MAVSNASNFMHNLQELNIKNWRYDTPLLKFKRGFTRTRLQFLRIKILSHYSENMRLIKQCKFNFKVYKALGLQNAENVQRNAAHSFLNVLLRTHPMS